MLISIRMFLRLTRLKKLNCLLKSALEWIGLKNSSAGKKYLNDHEILTLNILDRIWIYDSWFCVVFEFIDKCSIARIYWRRKETTGHNKGCKKCWFLGSIGNFSFQSSFLLGDDDAVPISSTFHTLSRCAQWLKIRAEEIKSLADSNGEFQQNRQFIDWQSISRLRFCLGLTVIRRLKIFFSAWLSTIEWKTGWI